MNLSVRNVVLAGLLLVMGNAGHATVDSPLKIQLNTNGLKPWLDFYSADSFIAFNLAVHGHPLVFTSDMHIKPGYIKSWKWDSSRKLYILKMDTNKTYHNGKKISAQDFEFALVKPLLTTIAGIETAYVKQIKGYDKLKKGAPFKTGMLEGVKVIDAETIEITPITNSARFLYNLNGEVPPLAPIDEFQKDLFTFKSLPVGCGPYKVIWSDPTTSVVRIERVSGTAGPKIVELHADKTGYENKVDITFGPGTLYMKRYMDQHPAEYSLGQPESPIAIETLEFNYRLPAVQNINFRKAVAFAIDKDDLAKTSKFGLQPADQLISKISYGYSKMAPYYDFKKAKELFQGLPQSIRNAEYKLVCHGAPNSKPAEFYKRVHASLTSIGMKVVLSLDGDTSLGENQKDVAMVVNGRTVDAYPLITFGNFLPAAERYNTPKENDDYAKIFEKADQAENIEEKVRGIRALSKHIIDNQIVIPLAERYDRHYYSPRVKKVAMTEITGYLDIANIELINDKHH